MDADGEKDTHQKMDGQPKKDQIIFPILLERRCACFHARILFLLVLNRCRGAVSFDSIR